MTGGILRSETLSTATQLTSATKLLGTADFSFVQISDSHIGFNKAANPDVTATLMAAIARINALPTAPDFLLHTGDLSQLSKPEEFDTLEQSLKTCKASRVFYVPGEHDVLGDDGKQYLERFGKGTKGQGWYSFDKNGVHFVGLVNVLNLQAGGLGYLGADQLEWLKNDLAGLSASTPIVVFAHIPLWSVYPEWGWGTSDSAQALALLRRFGSVSVLNGHIHQTMQKVEGNITFHTAMSTAFPQPKPGAAPSPGPMKVAPGELRSVLGITDVHYMAHDRTLAFVDSSLQAAAAAAMADSAPASAQVHIDNFTFSPAALAITAGTTVTWRNTDDVPHNVRSTDNTFPNSPTLDTDQVYSYKFDRPGTYAYFCGLHPHMTGKVIVK
jgi:plastocyanin